MPFWKKSEDPWDIDPEKRRRAAETEREPGILDTLREEWDTIQTERQEKKAALRLTPEKCPWCGKEMEQGFLMGGKGIWWYRGIPTGKALWLGSGSENTMRVDVEGGFLTAYKTAWYCPDCKKMTINAADLWTRAEENDPFFRRTETAEQGEEEI